MDYLKAFLKAKTTAEMDDIQSHLYHDKSLSFREAEIIASAAWPHYIALQEAELADSYIKPYRNAIKHAFEIGGTALDDTLEEIAYDDNISHADYCALVRYAESLVKSL